VVYRETNIKTANPNPKIKQMERKSEFVIPWIPTIGGLLSQIY
jgi:hypothetical protein